MLLNTFEVWGGDERWTLNIARGLKERGHYIVIACHPGSEMEKRAQELGFNEVSSEEIFYILVPGYFYPDQIEIAGAPGNSHPVIPTVAPEYSQSLVDWLRERVFDPASPLIQEVKP